MTVTTMQISPIDTLIDLLVTTLKKSTGYGTVQTHATDDLSPAHDGTEITIRRDNGEGLEIFVARVWAEREPGDQVDWEFAAKQVTLARITRRAALPLRYEPGDDQAMILGRFKELLDAVKSNGSSLGS